MRNAPRWRHDAHGQWKNQFTSTFLIRNRRSESGIYAYCLYLSILIMGSTL
jgi:hypothetical protein